MNSAEMKMKVTDEMVNRFLGWKLPADFKPDAGISFKAEFNENTPWPMRHEPTGTNLLDAIQTRAMLEYVLASPNGEPDARESPSAGQEALKRAFYVVSVELLQSRRRSALDDEARAALDWGLELGKQDKAIMFGDAAPSAGLEERVRGVTPCPFCGSTDISDGEILTGTPDGRTYTQSECQDCKAVGPAAYLAADEVDYGCVKAIAAWNRRP